MDTGDRFGEETGDGELDDFGRLTWAYDGTWHEACDTARQET